MTDTQVLEGATPKSPAQPMSPGAMLRELRTAAGVNLAMVASMVKVTPQKLDALERDQYEELPDMTFARGLVASVCRALGADPKPLLARMPAQSAALHLAPQQPAVVPFSRPGDAPAPLLASTAAKVVLAVVAILVAASVIVWFWPTMPSKVASSELSDPMASPAPATHADAESDAGPDQAGGEEEAHSLATGAAATPAAAPTLATPTQPGVTTERLAPAGAAAAPASPAAATAGGPAAGSGVERATAAAAMAAGAAATGSANSATTVVPVQAAENATGTTPAAAAAAGSQLLTLKATGESWVGVRDASGKSLLNRTLKAGDSVDLDGQAPLSVVIGRKQAVAVLVRGQPFDDQSLSNATVARFQVK